jgi:hypothetical protein
MLLVVGNVTYETDKHSERFRFTETFFIVVVLQTFTLFTI